MAISVFDSQVLAILRQARFPHSIAVNIDGKRVEVPKPFPSPADWRDHIIYFLMVDRFNNPAAPPNHLPFDEAFDRFQGGTLKGVQEQLGYLKSLGVGAIWMTPVFQNPLSQDGTYHGYGIQNFLAIDPRWGTEQELQALINEAHGRGMYIIFDVVINHAGDVFEYQEQGAVAPFRASPYDIFWRGADGRPNLNWKVAPQDMMNDPALTPEAAVFPDELRANQLFRRQGSKLEGIEGDFFSLKEFKTEVSEITTRDGFYHPVQDTLIKVYQYAIAKFDIDGLRIDTLKHVERSFARIFGNAIREFAQSIGKKNFFTFGEVFDDEEKIASYTGRFASDPDDLMGVDAALDFPFYFTLPDVVKGFKTPLQLANLFEYRKLVHRGGAGHGVLISTHGEASRFFVTFLDNHDQNHRFRFSDSSAPHYFDAQVSMGMACLLTLQGIPALYYGTEQGLHGMGDSDQSVREALWGKPGAFDTHHPLFKAFQEMAAVRAQQPALRYGRQYFRGTSEDGAEFGIAATAPGIIAFSRILHDMEVVIVANPQIEDSFSGFVIIDFALNPPETAMDILYSNQGVDATAPGWVIEKAENTVTIHGLAGEITTGPVRLLPLTLKPMEIQILGRKVDLKIAQEKEGRMSRMSRLSALVNTFRSKFASYFSGA